MMDTSTELRKIKYGLSKTLADLENRIKLASGDRPRILYVAPHLSTGGMPQYLCKKIESFLDHAEIFCIEYSNVSDEYVVQRNRIQRMLGDRFFTLGEDKNKILDLIHDICPDIIHFDDFVEFFVDEEIIEKIFDNSRPYYIYETCHSSNISPYDKTWRPDKFVMVNQWMVNKFSELDTPLDILEYPIENYQRPPRQEALSLLGLDPHKKHIINVGLFTPGKNQGYLMDIARKMENYPIEFHFIGNQAPNFSDYWSPLMKNVPGNCRIWGERNDVDTFYQAADLFVFTSVWELNPIVIKETLSWNLPVLMRRLEPYMDSYDNNPLVTYLSQSGPYEDVQKDINSILQILQLR
jgi:glycosyltransferase involved in cell wall biosynthesis